MGKLISSHNKSITQANYVSSYCEGLRKEVVALSSKPCQTFVIQFELIFDYLSTE